MNVVICPHYFAPHTGGIERVAGQHAGRLASRGHEVTVLASRLGDEPRHERRAGYEVVRYGAYNPLEARGIPYPVPKPRSFRAAFRTAVDCSTDVLHVHGLNYLSTAMATGLAGDVPVVLHQHTPFVEYDQPWRLAERINDGLLGRWSLSRSNRIICASHHIREYVRTLAPETDTEVVPNGVDTERFHPDAVQEAGESWSSGRPTVFALARPAAKKGLDTLLSAAERLDERRIDVDLVVGGGGLEAVRQRVAGIDTVRTLGFVPDAELPARYAAASAFVFTSTGGEAFPTLTVLEALASGTPVVATRVDGRATGLDHGTNGLLVPPGDPDGLAEAVERLASDPATIDRMGSEARRTVVDRFDLATAVDAVEKVYRDVV